MTKTCSVTGCRSNLKKQSNKISIVTNKATVFGFPKQSKHPDLYRKWVSFCVQKDFVLTENSGICSHHFNAEYIKVGKRKTLRWVLAPVPTNYGDLDIPHSVRPTPTHTRKPPTDRSTLPDQLNDFRAQDAISNFDDLDESICPPGYKLEVHEENRKAIFYKMEKNNLHNIPEVTATIVVDDTLCVKLYKSNLPLPLPQWLRSNGECRLSRKSILLNLASYIHNFTDMDNVIPNPDNIPKDIMDELLQLRYKKGHKKNRFSANLLRYSLLLYYTSPQAYRMLLEQFPFPSITYLRKLCQGGVEPLKACKVLLEQGKMDKDVVLMLDEIYLQKEEQYSGGTRTGADVDGKLFKGVMTFMIISLKKSIPFVVKAIPEIKIEGKWLSDQIDSVIKSISKESGLQVRAVVADNHSTNISAYNHLIKSYGNPSNPYTITHPSNNKIIYLFYDAVHLVKNIRNNLLNARRFLFPPFKFDGFYDPIDVPGGEITWKLLHDVYDTDQALQANLRKAPKLSYRTLHPGDNKQSVPLALNIFHRTTSIGIISYFPDRKDAAEFLKLIDTWWIISNSKEVRKPGNTLGNAAVAGDMKPLFFRKFADWIQAWQDLQGSNSQKFTLTAQTSKALITTLRCTASLIEDLLNEGYQYILTARFQTDPLERRFSKTRQMSGGRFLIGLREFNTAQKIISITSLIKESIAFWKEDVRPNVDHAAASRQYNSELDLMKDEIDVCTLNADSMEVAAVIAGFATRNIITKGNKCATCKILSTAAEDEVSDTENSYLNELSRGGLIVPSVDLRHYVAKSFAILDLCQYQIRKSSLPEKKAAEISLLRNDCPLTFLCREHKNVVKFINRMVVNVFLNNSTKVTQDSIRKDGVKQFKTRQRTKTMKE